jgi:hypothetical protein
LGAGDDFDSAGLDSLFVSDLLSDFDSPPLSVDLHSAAADFL